MGGLFCKILEYAEHRRMEVLLGNIDSNRFPNQPPDISQVNTFECGEDIEIILRSTGDLGSLKLGR